MHDLTEGKGEFTLILDDPAGNSFLQNIYAPEEDPNMNIEVEFIDQAYTSGAKLGVNSQIQSSIYQLTFFVLYPTYLTWVT